MIATCWTLCIRFPLPIRFRTRPFFDGVKLCTTPYYKVLLRTAKYYSVLQTTNSVLHGTSKYYSVLQSTTPSLFRTTKYNKEILSTAKCYPALRSPFDSRNTWTVRFIAGSNLSDAKHNGTTTFMLDSRSNTCNIMYIARSNQNHLQHHQILPRPWQMAFQDIRQDLANGWTVIYIRRSNRSHPPTSPNIALVTKNDVPKYQIVFGKRLNCPLHPAEHPESPSTSPNIALATKQDMPPYQKKCRKWLNHRLHCAEQPRSPSNITIHCACYEKWHSKISEELSFTSWEATRVTFQLHQIAPATQQKIPGYDINLWKRWNVMYNAGPIREWSDHEPVSPQPAVQLRILCALTTRIVFGKVQHVMLLLSS